jgi:hypothetical protein
MNLTHILRQEAIKTMDKSYGVWKKAIIFPDFPSALEGSAHGVYTHQKMLGRYDPEHYPNESADIWQKVLGS